MPATTPLGFRYWLPTDPPSIHGATQALATDVDAYLSPVAVMLTRSSGGTSIANGTATPVGGWDTTLYSKGGLAYAGSGAFTPVPVGGLYVWSMTLTAPPTTPAYFITLRVLVNGFANGSGQLQTNVSANSNTQSFPPGGGPLLLAAGDVVTLIVQQTSGAAMTVTQVSASLVRVGS